MRLVSLTISITKTSWKRSILTQYLVSSHLINSSTRYTLASTNTTQLKILSHQYPSKWPVQWSHFSSSPYLTSMHHLTWLTSCFLLQLLPFSASFISSALPLEAFFLGFLCRFLLPFDVVFLGDLFTICSPHTPMLCSNFFNNPISPDEVFWLIISLLNSSVYFLEPIEHFQPFSLNMQYHHRYYYHHHHYH